MALQLFAHPFASYCWKALIALYENDAPFTYRMLDADHPDNVAELVPFARPDLCCGFGGTFSVRQPEVSVAMADEKLAGGAPTIVTADPGCLMHLRGRAEKVGSAVRVVHLATALARGVHA